jgi:hypothetical protein
MNMATSTLIFPATLSIQGHGQSNYGNILIAKLEKVKIFGLLVQDCFLQMNWIVSSTAFHRGGATEQAREQIGVVTLHAGDSETANSFLDDVET